jgi:hypothetical protein
LGLLKTRRSRWLNFDGVISALAVCLVVGACGDAGTDFLTVDNTTSEALLARASGVSFNPTESYAREPYEQVFSIPAKSRLAVAELTFAGSPEVNHVEILRGDCSQVADLSINGSGALIVITEGPKTELRQEYPDSGVMATPTEQCPSTR